MPSLAAFANYLLIGAACVCGALVVLGIFVCCVALGEPDGR